MISKIALFYIFAFVIANAARITFGRAAFLNGADLWNHLVQVSFFSAIIVLLTLLPFLYKDLKDLILKTPKVFLLCVGVVTWHFGIGTSLSITALQYTMAPNASFIPKIHIVFVVLWEFILFKQLIKKKFIVALLICLTGLWLMSTHGKSFDFNTGDILLVVAAFMWSVSDIVSKYLIEQKDVKPEILAFLRPFGFFLILPLIIYINNYLGFISAPITPSQWPSDPSLIYAFFAALCLCIVWIFLNRAYATTKVSNISLITYSEAVFVIIFASVFLNENLQLAQYIGGSLIVLGSGMFIFRKS